MNKLLHFVCLCIVLLTTVATAFGRHIIGGEFQYECLGEGNYKVTMTIYRDCRQQSGPVADFDGADGGGAFIAIYHGANYVLVSRLTVPLKSRSFIKRPDYPCLIPPENLCVEKGIYEFTVRLAIWPSTESYHLVYQRCCRNNTINNLQRPQDLGATYTVEITPQSQAYCNNSPTFEEFPPTVLCVGASLDFNHSATDVDGDSLVYEFCDVLDGGGNRGTSSQDAHLAGTCEGVRPDPPCSPPFEKAMFSAGFTARRPMAGNPVVGIDRQKGMITGKPEIIGQFVIAVCVLEYRDGELIGSIQREFQFNVADCDPTVFASVRSDAEIGDREFVINSCGNNTVTFKNESQLQQFIDTYRWEFDIDGSTTVLDTRDATVTFPGLGTYRGVMMVNPGLDCGDTADIYVNLYPSIDADFTVDYDTCIHGPTVFTDLSRTGADRLESWQWDFGDGGETTLQHPRYTYGTPGKHPVSLIVTDNNECKDTAWFELPYFPVPELVVVEPNQFIGCAPADIFFDNLSVPIDSTYDIRWDFGDGGTSGKVSPTHQYTIPGFYDVTLQITSPIGCTTSADYPGWIEIRESPTADFSFTPELPSNFRKTVEFENLGTNFINQEWLFGNIGRSTQIHPTYTFPDTGLYNVQLVNIHANGCTDTAVQELYVIPRVTYHMPNAFTPNGDGKNDTFGGVGYTQGIKSFLMTIWSRWGELLYETRDPEQGWNGTKFNSGPDLPMGVYVYQVYYIDPLGKEVREEGFATLVR